MAAEAPNAWAGRDAKSLWSTARKNVKSNLRVETMKQEMVTAVSGDQAEWPYYLAFSGEKVMNVFEMVEHYTADDGMIDLERRCYAALDIDDEVLETIKTMPDGPANVLLNAHNDVSEFLRSRRMANNRNNIALGLRGAQSTNGLGAVLDEAEDEDDDEEENPAEQTEDREALNFINDALDDLDEEAGDRNIKKATVNRQPPPDPTASTVSRRRGAAPSAQPPPDPTASTLSRRRGAAPSAPDAASSRTLRQTAGQSSGRRNNSKGQVAAAAGRQSTAATGGEEKGKPSAGDDGQASVAFRRSGKDFRKSLRFSRAGASVVTPRRQAAPRAPGQQSTQEETPQTPLKSGA